MQQHIGIYNRIIVGIYHGLTVLITDSGDLIRGESASLFGIAVAIVEVRTIGVQHHKSLVIAQRIGKLFLQIIHEHLVVYVDIGIHILLHKHRALCLIGKKVDERMVRALV